MLGIHSQEKSTKLSWVRGHDFFYCLVHLRSWFTLSFSDSRRDFAESQGFPRRPALERIYRQTGASLVQLGFLGVGAAVFADLQRELQD